MSGTKVLMGTASNTLVELALLNANFISLIIPVLLLFLTIVMFSLDFGAAGVGIFSSFALVILFFMGVIPVNLVTLVPLIIIIVLTIFKVSR